MIQECDDTNDDMSYCINHHAVVIIGLRSCIQDLPGANLKADFTIFDSDDSLRTMRKVIDGRGVSGI